MEDVTTPTNDPAAPHTVEGLLRVVEERDAEVVLLKLMVDKLKLQLLRSLWARFGSSSEQLDDPQIALLEGAPLYEVPAPAVPAAPDAANAPQIDRKLLAHLPRESQLYRPETSTAHHDADGQPCGCTACGGRLRLIGRDVSEQLEYVPSRFKVIRHVRPKLACVACEAIFQAAAPSRPIARGMAGPGLLANVLVSKYCDHIPLHRLSRIYGRDRVVIDPSTMAGWVGQSEKLFDPLLAALGRYVLAGEKVHADDTPVAVLDPAEAAPTLAGCGSTFATTDPPETPSRLRPGIATRPTARASIRRRTLRTTAAFSKPMRMVATGRSTRAGASSKRHAGRTRVDRSGICTKARASWRARSPSRRSSASPRCMRSKPRSADSRRT